MSDFLEFGGYRNMILEEKIGECLAAAARGETYIAIDRDDLTDEELQYVGREFRRRLRDESD